MHTQFNFLGNFKALENSMINWFNLMIGHLCSLTLIVLKLIEKTLEINSNCLKSKIIAKDFNQVKENCVPEISKRYERARSARRGRSL